MTVPQILLFLQPILYSTMRPIIIFLLSFFCAVSAAQSDTAVLVTINGEDITVSEFTSVYLKNRDLVQEEDKSSPSEYLDLFIDYKLKVQEAYRLGLDKKSTYQKELSSYRTTLAKNYLTDVKVTESLVREAYERLVNERKARHILVRVSPDAKPEDTLIAFAKILEARTKVVNGEDFLAVARTYSEDPSAKKNGGDLGFFKAFKMVYPFENAAYTTEINEVSEPFRTRFGYHIVQPTATRIGKGSIEAAHIMITTNQKDDTSNPEEKINEIYKQLNDGADFTVLARTYSDDKKSSAKGGSLSPFEEGQLSSPEFENKVFALNEAGQITEPFKTAFGWHIAKLIKKNPVGTYKELKKELETKILRDSRAQVLSEDLNERLRKRYNSYNDNEIISFFRKELPKENFKTDWKYNADKPVFKEVAFTVGDTTFTYKNIADYLFVRRNNSNAISSGPFIENNVKAFIDGEIKKYHTANLEKEDKKFAAILREYEEGLLLFDLLETQVWNVAKNDSTGLKEFFAENVDNYRTKAALKATSYTLSNEKAARALRKSLEKGKSLEVSLNRIEKFNIQKPIIVTKEYYIDDLPKKLIVKEGITDVFRVKSSYIFYNISEVSPAKLKSLEDSRGLVMSDFQKYIDDNFVQGLRDRAIITIDKNVVSKLNTSLSE